MNLTEKELSVLNELLTIEENIWKKYQMYCERHLACDVVSEGVNLHKQNLDKLYTFVR